MEFHNTVWERCNYFQNFLNTKLMLDQTLDTPLLCLHHYVQPTHLAYNDEWKQLVASYGKLLLVS